MPRRWPTAVTATDHCPSACTSRPVERPSTTSGTAPWAASRAPSASSTATQQSSSSPSAAAMASTPPPPSTTSVNRSCAVAACSMPACAVDSASSAAAVSAARRVCTSDTAASAASEPSSATSSRRNGRRVRLAANSTPTNCAVHQQRRAADGDQPLLADGGVDLGGVPVALVGGVVGRPVGPPGLGDEPAEPGPGGQPQRLEPGGDGARGGAHVGVAALRVGQREVGDVGGQQGAGPAHDRVEHAAGVGARGEVAGGVDQRGQLGLAAPARVDPGPDGQGERARGGPVDRVGGDQLGGRLLDPIDGRVLREQPQQLQHRHDGASAGEVRRRARSCQIRTRPGSASGPRRGHACSSRSTWPRPRW